MKRLLSPLGLTSVLLLSCSATAFAAPPTRDFVPVQDRDLGRSATELSLWAPGRILVQIEDSALRRSALVSDVFGRSATPTTGLADLDQAMTRVGATSVQRSHIEVRNASLDRQLGISRWFTFQVDENADIEALAAELRALPSVDEATPDYRAFPAAVPNDPLYSSQWGHNNTGQLLSYCWSCGGHPSGSPVGTVGFDANAQAAWDASQGYGNSGIVIAILDSGVSAGHPDLNQVAGYDYGDNDSNPDDNSASPGHGTACAGVAAAIANNSQGAAGIAGGCSIMPLKCADSGGSLFFSYIQNALYHAADNGADVASMSFGAAISSDPATDSALSYAFSNGVTLLAASGNENASSVSYPANNTNVIAVGAASPCGERKRSSSSTSELNPGVSADPNGYTCDGERWWGSNYGSTTQNASTAVDVIAPTILPTTDIVGSGGYDPGNWSMWFNGTSCATPYAAGVCALIKAANPSWTPSQVRTQLRNTAQDVTSVESGAGWDRYTGYGMVDAAAAVGGGGGPGGPTYASLPYTTGFESASLDASWTTASTGPGRILVTTANTPHAGTRHLTMDSSTSNSYATNFADLHLDLAGEGNVDLEFWWKEFGDETHAQDGVYFSDNGGSSFVKVQDLNGASYTNNTWQNFALDLDALASANGLSLTSTFVIRFEQYDNYPIATDGFAFDDISVTSATGPANSVTVTSPNGGETWTAGTAHNVTWTWTGSFANVAIAYSTNAGSTWTTITSSTANDGSYSWTVPSAATTQGRVRVSDAADAGTSDTSNSNFTIDVPPVGGYASLPYSTGFETGSLDTYWDTTTTTTGRILVTGSNAPHAGSWHLTMDSSTNGTYATNDADLKLNLSGHSQVAMSFWWKEFGDETHTQDGVYFSSNGGASFVKVYSLNGGSVANNTWQNINLDVDALAAANGLSLTSTFVVRFQQYDNYAIATDGFAFDDISVVDGGGGGGGNYITAESEPNDGSTTADGPVGSDVAVTGTISSSADDDWFAFDVTTGGTISISVAIGSSADLDWYLYAASDPVNWVARGYTVSNPEAGTYNAAAGSYFVRVDGYNGATSAYTLTVSGTNLAIASGPEKIDSPVPAVFQLAQNAPNPFHGSTMISLALPKPGNARLAVYDVTGRLVRTLVNGEMKAGVHRIHWDGRDERGSHVASGVYLYKVDTAENHVTKKMILTK
ncbi:MAG: S8 family serine peptidase [bacterium]